MSNESRIRQGLSEYEQRWLDDQQLLGERELGERTAQQILDEARTQKALNVAGGQEAKKDPKKDTDTVQRILDKRGEKYGDYAMMCLAAQTLKSVVARRPGNYSHAQQESLDMICTKLARIAVGDCNEIDSWRDIAGYATLITNILMKKQ